MNFRRSRDNGSGAIAVESERRLALPCGVVLDEILAMRAEGRLSGYGYGWMVRDFGVKFTLDLDPEALGLPRV